jgi:uncharacterized protein (TIGR02001 family)
MRKSIVSLSMAVAALAPALAAAADAPPVTGNGSVVSDYRFRGISQTYLGPAVQGGIDYAHSSGLYVGNWNSSISGNVFPSTSGIEMDVYAGYKKSFGDFGLDVGGIYYYYPKAKTPAVLGGDDFNNLEAYLGGSWKWLSAKLFYALSDYFGLNDSQANNWFAHRDTGAALGAKGSSKGTTYLDLGVTFPVTKEFSVVAHYGMLSVKKYSELDYNDWKLGVTYDLAGWVLGAAYVDTDADPVWYYTNGSGGIKESGKGGVVLSVTKSF